MIAKKIGKKGEEEDKVKKYQSWKEKYYVKDGKTKNIRQTKVYVSILQIHDMIDWWVLHDKFVAVAGSLVHFLDTFIGTLFGHPLFTSFESWSIQCFQEVHEIQ